MARIQEIGGIGPVNVGKLAELGIETVEALLERGASPIGRRPLIEGTDISAKLILKWVNRATWPAPRG